MGAVKTLYATMPNGAKQFARDMANHQRKPEARLAPAPVVVVAEIVDACQCGHGEEMHADFGTHYGACSHPLCNCMSYAYGGL